MHCKTNIQASLGLLLVFLPYCRQYPRLVSTGIVVDGGLPDQRALCDDFPFERGDLTSCQRRLASGGLFQRIFGEMGRD